MLRTLSKVNSASKLEEPSSSLPTSTGSKFRRTNKKQSIEDTNATSEKTESILEQDPPSAPSSNSIRQPIARTNRQQQRQESRLSSQISDPFLNIKNNSSKIKTEPDEPSLRPNFIKKNNVNLALGPTLSPQGQGQKGLKSTLSPRANIISKNSSQPAEIGPVASQIKPAPMLKRSSALLFVAERLMRQKMAASLKALQQNRRIGKNKMQRQAWVVFFAVSGFYTRLQGKLKREAVNRCKMITAKPAKDIFSIQQETVKLSNKKIINSLPNLLHLLFRSKLKSAFIILAKNRALKQAIRSCHPTLLDFYQKRKIRAAFDVFKRSAILWEQRKSVLIGQVESAFRFCARLALAQPLKKIKLFATSSKNTQSSIPKAPPQNKSLQKNNTSQILSPRHSQSYSRKEKITIEMERMEKESNDISQRMAQKRRTTDAQGKKAKKNIEQLRKKNEQMKKEVNQKQETNQMLKQQTASFQKSQSPIQEDPSSQSSLSILQQVHSEISKASQTGFPATLQRLIKELQITTPSHQNQQIKTWLLLGQRQALQSQIDAYEGQILGHKAVSESRINRAMREQSSMVVQMIRNYIKQRYLWGQVEKFISKVL